MWIEKLSNGKYRAVERYTDPMTEKQRKVSVTIEKDTAQQRKKAAAALDEKIRSKLAKKEKSYTVHELLDLYIENKKIEVKLSTYKQMYNTKGQFISIFSDDIIMNKLTAKYVRDLILKYDCSTNRKNNLLEYFKTFVRWCYKNDYIDDIRFIDKILPFSDSKELEIDPEKLPKKLFLEGEELNELLNVVTLPYAHQLTQFLALSGLRIGEALALELNDIDLDKRIIYVNKNFGTQVKKLLTPKSETSNREIYIQDELLPIIKAIKSEAMQNYLITRDSHIFISDGIPVKYGAYHSYLVRCTASLGYKLTPHGLRHTHVAILAEQGLSLDEISRRLGHENSRITKKIYFHVTKKLKEKDHKKLNKVKFL